MSIRKPHKVRCMCVCARNGMAFNINGHSKYGQNQTVISVVTKEHKNAKFLENLNLPKPHNVPSLYRTKCTFKDIFGKQILDLSGCNVSQITLALADVSEEHISGVMTSILFISGSHQLTL